MLYFTTNLTFLAISVFKFYSIVLINKQSLFKNEMPHDIRKNLYDQKIKEKNDRKHQIATRKLLPHHDKVTVIERYFEAYEKGLISYEEFKQKKQEVLKKRI
jgi:hypothetical protein